jgi:hypothetical protein
MYQPNPDFREPQVATLKLFTLIKTARIISMIYEWSRRRRFRTTPSATHTENSGLKRRQKSLEQISARLLPLPHLGRLQSSARYQALHQEIDLGLLLPCNAVVYERDGQVFTGVVDA